MIHKSYLIEENIDQLKNNIVLFYGENLGLKNDFRDKIKLKFKNTKILRYTQEEVLKSSDIIINEIRNISLFDDQKILLIDQVNDKLLNLIEELTTIDNETKIFLFADVLEKRSKLRSFFEKSKNCDVVACYKDNEINLKKLISNKLKEYSGVTPQLINTLIENCSLDRIKLNNELNKIVIFFSDKNIKPQLFEKILNQQIDDDFNTIKDSAINGNKINTNKLLSSTVLEIEKNVFYISIINQRLNKLKEIFVNANKKNITEIIDNIKPPIFWKDKPNFILQAKKWNEYKLNIALEKTYKTEIKLKSYTDINKNLLIKKLLVDVCDLANAS